MSKSEGAPEDLVLRGVFGAASQSEGVRFDEETGSFTTCSTFHDEVAVTGEGTLGRWTRRALERRGFRVSNHERYQTHVHAARENGAMIWELSRSGRRERHGSIESLLGSLSHGEERNSF